MADQAPAFLSSSVGRKIVMALTGLLLLLFVLGHMLGNLQVFRGPEAFNAYGEALRKFPPLLWGVRIGLLLLAGLHVWAAVSLTLDNWRARPVGYRALRHRESTYASRTMRWSGVILLLYVLYHLAHLTWGVRGVHPGFVPGDVYRNVVTGFRAPLASGLYIAAMVALGFHLHHGFWSGLQTLGLSHPRWDRVRGAVSALLALLIVGGYVSVPLAVLAGLVRQG